MKRTLFVLLCTSLLHAQEYSPWFSPLWEFHERCSFSYRCDTTVQSPEGNFSAPSNDYTLENSLWVTPWPYWSAELGVLLTQASQIPFSYEAAYCTVRYQWLDDLQADPIACATGLTLFFPAHRYLHHFSYTYHGEMNAEVHAAVGKEWICHDAWWNVWLLGGYGIANRGNGWVHGRANFQLQLHCLQWDLFSEMLFGLGSHDILPNQSPFSGYASIAHHTLDIGSQLSYQMDCVGILALSGWYNVYARNCIEDSWEIAIGLQIPFSP